MLNAVNTEHCTLRKKLPPAIKDTPNLTESREKGVK